ncbi:hypothetical protein IH781_01070 [Patescibacteria group bacterium]|nr:hypothetical protein [Patescibacteria group bacterium]
MSRFTDENKWSDKWFRSLTPPEKLVWLYLCDNCDIAGFYEIDSDYIAFHTGLNTDEVSGAIQALNRGYIGAKGTDYIWIKNFLRHQKNHILNSSNNCHKGIIKRIEGRLNLFPEIPKILGAEQGLFSPIGKGKGKGRGNSKGKESLKDQESLDVFDVFRKAYPGTKNGNEVEFENFQSKNTNWQEVLPDLKPLRDCIINQRSLKKSSGGFVAEWKNLSTWINQKCWTEEVGKAEEVKTTIGEGSKWTTD